MIERPIRDLPGSTEAEMIGVAACSFACPGCPISLARASATVRIVGFDPETTPHLIRCHRLRLVELASGDLPSDPEIFSELRDAGLRRVILPLFGLESEHDVRVRVDGAYDRALASLQAAEAAGLDRLLVYSLPHAPRKKWLREEYDRIRRCMRMGWAHRTPCRWSFAHQLPCFLARTAYNEIDG